MASDRKEDGKDRSDQNPPFLLPPIQEKAHQEQEDRDDAHIHRSGRERLGTPVKGKVFGYFLDIGLAVIPQQGDGLGFVWIDRPGGRVGTLCLHLMNVLKIKC